jgi:hypothetical protein
MGSGSIPVIVPPDMATASAFCTDIEPSPKELLAPAAVPAPVPPDAIPIGADNPEIVPPVIATALEVCCAMVPSMLLGPVTVLTTNAVVAS